MHIQDTLFLLSGEKYGVKPMSGKALSRSCVAQESGEQPRVGGERGNASAGQLGGREQPRMRGEKRRRPLCRRVADGTTPHARGIGSGFNTGGVPGGNNPAWAGKDGWVTDTEREVGTAPRARGKSLGSPVLTPAVGTTPRTRGIDFTTSGFSEHLSSFLSTVSFTLVQHTPRPQHLNSSRPSNHCRQFHHSRRVNYTHQYPVPQKGFP